MKLYFKSIAVTIVPFVVSMFMFYLVGSFLSVSFDPAEWTLEMRSLMAIFGGVFGGAMYLKLQLENLV
jgi:hypothetical protein